MHLNSVLLTIAFSSWACGIQFQDNSETDSVLNINRQSQGAASGFFPQNDDLDERYSSVSENRKQLNFNPGNVQRPQYRPQIQPQFDNAIYQNYPINYNRPQSVNPGRKRKRPKKPSQANMLSSLYNGDMSNPLYQNYANYYQYPQASTKYPSASTKYPSPYAQYPSASSQYPSASSQYPSASSQYPSASSQYPSTSSQYPFASSQYPLSTQYPGGPMYSDYYSPTRYPMQQQQQQPNLYNQQQQQSLQNPNYANEFGYQRPSTQFANNGVGGLSNGISNFFNSIRETNGPLGQLNQAGGQFSKALEDISINDDLQCVPKLVCQMIRNPRRPNALPSFLNIPGLTAIIAALPSTSPLMNFGRAALLGLSGGECDTTYPRCPRNEEQLLYYLNNHRGGFFRFFNGGAGFGDDSGNQNFLQGGGLQQQQQQQQQHQQQQQQQQGGFLNQGYPQQQQSDQTAGASQGLNLLALQALAEAVNQGNGINLANLFGSQSNNQPITQNYQADQSQNSGLLGMFGSSSLSDIVSNLLTGVVGNRFSRRISKRSIPDLPQKIEEKQPEIQERIINLKENAIESTLDFFPESSPQEQENIRNPKIIQQNTVIPIFTFPTNEIPVTDVLKFSDDARDQVNYSENNSIQNAAMSFPQDVQEAIQSTEANKGNFLSPSDIAKRIRMLFPDRTGTGSLRFDSNHFDKEIQALNNLMTGLRLGKILTGVNQAALNLNNYNKYPNYNQNYNQNYPQQQQQSNYQQQPIYYPSNNRYTGSSSSNNNNNYNNGQQSSNSGSQKHILYVTNSQGNIAYTLNELTGEKQQY